MPKDSRYSLGIKIDRLFVEALESLYVASYAKPEQKSTHLEKAAVRLDLIKFFLQVIWEIKALDTKKYTAISEKLNEIGRMLGGWMRQNGRAKENPAGAGK